VVYAERRNIVLRERLRVSDFVGKPACRRLARLERELGTMRARVGALVGDFEPLRAAPAFEEFLRELDRALGSAVEL
jgi:hypothetical protein